MPVVDDTLNARKSAVWNTFEQSILDNSLKQWLNHCQSQDTLKLYAFIATKLEKKDIRDVALRLQWMLRRAQNCMGRSPTKRNLDQDIASLLRQGYGYGSLSVIRNKVRNMMDDNDTLFARTKEKINIKDYEASKQTLTLLERNLATALSGCDLISNRVSHLPRLPVKMNMFHLHM